jgi:hypothetical protein
MAQETLYFSHDYNPFEDTQFESLVSKHKATGYAVYWRLVEMLHASASHTLPFESHIYTSVAFKFSIKPKDVETIILDCISDFKLFSADGAFFWSERVLRNIAKMKAEKEKKSKAGKKGAKKRWHDDGDAIAMP